MAFIGNLLVFLLEIYMWIVIASAMLSWLVAFEVLNIRNPQAANLVKLLNRATEPVYRPLRKYIPPLGGIDITPIIIILGISLLRSFIFKSMVLPSYYGG